MPDPTLAPLPAPAPAPDPPPRKLPDVAEAGEGSAAPTTIGSCGDAIPPLDLARFRPAGIVFDCDGLLVDTEPCWTVAEAAAFAARGLGYGVAEKHQFLGRSVPASVALMARMFGEVGNEPAILAEVLRLVAEAIAAQAEAMPGALELVERLDGRVPLAVASNSPRHLVELSLAKAGLTGRFAASVAADEVAAPKPAPDLYLGACALLGVAPSASLAFEDSATGVSAARAAGLAVVGVPTLAGQDLGSDLHFASLADEGLRAWARSL